MMPLAMAQTPVAATASVGEAMSTSSPLINNLVIGSEALNFILILIAAWIMLSVIKIYGKDAQMSGVFGLFLSGALVLGLSRFVLFLASLNVIQLEDHTLELAWHLVFYISMITFFLGGRMIYDLSKNDMMVTSFKKTYMWDGILAVYLIVVAVAVEVANKPFNDQNSGSALDHIGFIHMVAMVTGFLGALYLFQHAPRLGRMTGVMAKPILLAFLLLGCEHAWEMMHESWGFFQTNPENFGDLVEEFFVVPSSILVIIAFMRLKRVITNPAPVVAPAASVAA